MDNRSEFEKLPREMQQLIFNYMDIATAGKIERTQKSFRKAAEQQFWHPILLKTNPETFFKTPISLNLSKLLGITPNIFKDLNKAFTLINRGKIKGAYKHEGSKLINEGCAILIKMPFNEFVHYYFPFYVLKVTKLIQPAKIINVALDLVKAGANHDPYCMLLYAEILSRGIPGKFNPTNHEKDTLAPSFIKQAIFVLNKSKSEPFLDANITLIMALRGEGAVDVIKKLSYSKLLILTTEQIKALCFCKNSKQFLEDDFFDKIVSLTPEQIITWATLRLDYPRTTATEIMQLPAEIIKEISDFYYSINYHASLGFSSNDLQNLSKMSLEKMLNLEFNEARAPIAPFIKIIKTKNSFTDLEKISASMFETIKKAIGKNYINAAEVLQKYTLIQLDEALNKFGSGKSEEFGEILAAKNFEELDRLLLPPSPSSSQT